MLNCHGSSIRRGGLDESAGMIFPQVHLPSAGTPGAMQGLIRHGGPVHHGGSLLDTILVGIGYS